MSGGAPALEMRGIRKQFPGVLALDGVDLTLHAGEVHMLLGENGAGKSTLMKVLSGACRKDAGEIRVDGRDAAIQSPRDAIDRGIRIIYQELNLVPRLSVAENIFLGAVPTRVFGFIDWRRLHQQTAALLADLGMAIDPTTSLHRLSLAHRQLVEIAKALRDDRSRVLVMDEPTSALTAREVDQLFALIQRLTARGVAIVYITHRLDEVSRIGQRVTVMRDGRRIATMPLAETSVPELVRMMANRDITEQFPKVRHPRGAELLRVDQVSRRGALSQVSLTLHAGEVVGIGGLLGAGRTELARVIAGVDQPDEGAVLLQGKAVRLKTPRHAIRRGIGLLPEDRKSEGLVAGLSVARNIALPHGSRLSRFGFLPATAEDTLARPIVADLRVKAIAGQTVRVLSGGNQQKVVLGKWLAGHANVFIFDEPTRGVDVGAKAEIYHLMNRLTAQGAAILMISSELPELLGMSDRVLVMCRGRIQAEFAAGTASEEMVLSAALGLA
jgi:ribose transport system ATP-binding protein